MSPAEASKDTIQPPRTFLPLKARRIFAEINFKILNKIFLIISIGLLVYSIFDFSKKSPFMNNTNHNGLSAPEEFPGGPQMEDQYPVVHYLETAQKRNIFSPYVPPEVAKTQQVDQENVRQEEVKKMAENLNLVGITWGDEAMAIVEDKTTGKTHFLKQNETIERFKVDAILTNKVILDFEGMKIELGYQNP